jgi:hypothetical protein
MTTVFEEYSTEEQPSVVRFLWTEALNTKDIHKEIFSVYGGKCLSRKEIHNWVEKLSQRRLKVTSDARPVVEVAQTTVKKLLS